MAGSEPLDRLEIEIEATSSTAETKLESIANILERVGTVAAHTVSPLKAVQAALKQGKRQSAFHVINKAMEQTEEHAGSLQKAFSRVSSGLDAVKFSRTLSSIDAELGKTDRQVQKLQDKLEYLKMPVSGNSATRILGVREEVAEAESKLKELEKVRSMLKDQRAALWSSLEQQDSDEVKKSVDDATASIRKMRKELSAQWSMWSSLKGMVHGVAEKIKNAVAASEKLSKALRYVIPIVGVITTLFRGIRSIAGTLLSVAKKVASAFAGIVKTIAGGAVNGIKKLGSGLKTVSKGVLNYVTKPFTRAMDVIKKWKNRLLSVAFYRTVRTALKMITDGFKEGIENLYLFSQEAGTQFAPTMDRLAASSLYLKNSLGALAAPLIQAVAPAVEMLINLFVDLLNVVNAVFAALTGQSSYTKALYHAASWGEDLDKSMGGAAGSAKELKRYLIGIDELNVMPEQNTGGGGGGGGLDTGDSNFEVADVPSALSDLATKIKEAIAAGDFTGAGRILAEKLNSVIDSWDAEAWGKKIGEKVQDGLEFFTGLVDNLDIEGLGGKISSLLSNALNEIDPITLGDTMAEGIKSAFRFVAGFVQNYDGPPIGVYLADVVNGWFKKLSELDKNGDSTFTKAGKLINQGINGIITGITDFINGLDSETIKTAFNQFFGQIKWGEIWDNLKTLAKTAADKIPWRDMLTSLWTMVTNIAVWIREEILGIKSADARKPWDELETKLEKGSDAITWIDALTALNTLLGDIVTKLIDMLPTEGWGKLWDDMKDKMAKALGTEDWEDLKSQLKGALVDVWDDVMDAVYKAISSQSGFLAGIFFPHRDELDDAIKDYKKDFEKYGEDVANVNLTHNGLSNEDVEAIKDLYKRTGGDFSSSDVLSEQAWQGDFKIKVQAVVDKINTSSLSPDDKSLAMTALLRTVNDATLPNEYRELVMSAIVQTVDSTALKDNQRNIVLTALLDTVNDTQLSVQDKTLIMTALIDAVDGNGISDENREILLRAGIVGIDDLIDPKAKVIDNVKAVAKSFVSGLTENPVIETISNFVSSRVNLSPEYRTITTWAQYDAIAKKNGLNWGFLTKDERTITTWAQYDATTKKNGSRAGFLTPEERTLETDAKFTSSTDAISPAQKVISVVAKITSFLDAAGQIISGLFQKKATGGIYTAGGWRPVEGYARGGTPRSGRLFYANENGMPELVGRIGSNTAVMNNGQIVASVASGVYRAVSAAMGGIGGYFASISNGINRIAPALRSIEPAEISPVRVWDSEPSYAQVDVTTRNDPCYGGADGMEASIRESNEDMINALYAVCQRVVTAINEKDTRIILDRQEVGRSATREQNRMATMYGKQMVNV